MNNKLGLQDLISALAERNGMDAKSATVFVKTVFEIVEEYISKDKLVKIKGLGTFKLVSVSDRESVNVNTGERILIAGHSKLSFTPDAALKDAVNRPFSDFETTVLRDTTSTEDMERIPSAEATDDRLNSEAEGDVEDGLDEEQTEDVSTEKSYTTTDMPEMEDSATSSVVEPEEEKIHIANATLPAEEGAPLATVEENVDMDTSSDEVDAEPAEVPDTHAVQQAEEEEIPPKPALPSRLSVATDIVRPSEDSGIQDNQTSYPMAGESITATSTDRHRHGWLYALLTLLLMAVSYVCGHYRLLDKLEISFYPEEETEERPIVKPIDVHAPQKIKAAQDSVVTEPKDSIKHDSVSVDSTAQKPQAPKKVQENMAEVAKYFSQVPNGEYWIVGDAGHVHYVQLDETLSLIAQRELGDRKLVPYLIIFNDFEDPNNIHRGEMVRIPKLAKKTDVDMP